MNNTWIKVYRKLLDNESLDGNAIAVLMWLLLMADRRTGQVTYGRFQIAHRLRIHPSSVYRALQKLEKLKIIEQQSNNKRTTSTITNWFKYQANRTSDSEGANSTSRESEQQSNTKQEYRNKKENIERDTSVKYLLALPTNDLAEFTLAFNCTDRQVINKAQSLYDYCQARGKKYKDYKAFLRNALRRDFGDRVQPPTVEQNLPEEMSAEGLERLRAMKEQVLVSKLKN